MDFQIPKIGEVLKSLVAQNAEEMATLQFVLRCAELLFNGFSSDIEVGKFLSELPEDLRRYLYGLVEALEIFQSIHGRRPSAVELASAPFHQEIRQIRDMCLEGSLRSVY